MKRLLVVYDVSFPSVIGGGQKRLYEIARRYSRDGVLVDWVCFKTWCDKTKTNKVPINYIGLPGFNGLYGKNGKRKLDEPIRFLYALLKSEVLFSSYDAILVGQWPLLPALYLTARVKLFKKRPIVIIDWWETWRKKWIKYNKIFGALGYLLERFILKSIAQHSKLITISKVGYEDVRAITKTDNHLYIPNGIDYGAISLSKPYPEKVDILYFGRLVEHKNVEMIIDAISLIKEEKGRLIKCNIVGNGPQREVLLSKIKKCGLSDVIKIIADVSDADMYRYLKSSAININPTTKDGGGSITLFEAYAASLPAIVFNSPGGVDKSYVSESNCGIVVDSIDAKALAASIYYLLSDNSLRQKYSCNASKYAQNFDWECIYKKYRLIFH